ncbi:MAG: hypothetical protein IKM46_00200 [Clostridia bacterium]|nr:hypothetical protein [Clostridia bacterium]
MNKRILSASLMLSISIIFIAYISEITLTVMFVKENSVLSIIIETLLFLCLGILAVIFSKRSARKVSADITKSIDSVVIEGEISREVYPELEGLLSHFAEQSRELEERIEKLSEEYARQDKMRSEFTANVSHELKTPLTSISGFAEIIRDGIVTEENIPRFAGNIYTEAQRLIVLVGDIIKLSQLDEAQSIVKEETDLYEACEAVISHLKSISESKKVKITLKGEHISVFGADQVLDEMIYNLCDNAIKYNRPDGEVFINIYLRDLRPVVSVRDTGIGIPPDDLPRVFQRFYRVNKSHSKEIGGTGLGLSIVKHGALFHEAELEIESRLGEGTEIRIVFPKIPDAVAKVTNKPPQDMVP